MRKCEMHASLVAHTRDLGNMHVVCCRLAQLGRLAQVGGLPRSSVAGGRCCSVLHPMARTRSSTQSSTNARAGSLLRYSVPTHAPVITKILTGAGGLAGDLSLAGLTKALLKIVGFLLSGWLIYDYRINFNRPAVEQNLTATGGSRYSTPHWDWDFVDCVYFGMVTMTTVGYGDMPTLRQEVRLVTIAFGLVGVVFIAGSIGFIAEWFNARGHKRFIE